MFGRLKFYYRNFKHYRAARKEGLDKEAAQRQAFMRAFEQQMRDDDVPPDEAERLRKAMPQMADVVARQSGDQPLKGKEFDAAVGKVVADALGIQSSGEPLDLPEEVAEILAEPGDFAPYDDDLAGRTITAEQLSLIRKVRFSWEGAERGAPMLDPLMPFGRRDVLTQMGEAFATGDAMEQARHYVALNLTLAGFLKSAQLAPGTYRLSNVNGAHIRKQFEGYAHEDETDLNNADIGLTFDDLANIEPGNLTLATVMTPDWLHEDEAVERIDFGEWPGLTYDPKRPYGAMSFIERDIADVLDELPEGSGSQDWEPTAEQALRYQRLHWQSLVTLQALAEHGELAKD